MTLAPSPELVAVVRRWNTAVRTRDSATLVNLLSASDHLRYVGSDEGEYWTGPVLRRGIVDHFREIPDFEEQTDVIEAFEAGNVGWAVWTGAFTFANSGKKSLHRISFVFHLEAGAWKIVQMHNSNPLSNVEKMGITHSALDALVAAARDGFDLEAQEGMVSVLFTDIVDSAALADAVGDRIWTARVSRHLSQVQARIEAGGGVLVKSLGDGTMSTFPSARGALNAAAAAMADVARDTSEPVLRMRAGLHTGEVIRSRGDFFGTVVNKAARIAASAGAGEVRLSDATRLIAGTVEGLTFGDPVSLELKGLPGTHVVYRLEQG